MIRWTRLLGSTAIIATAMTSGALLSPGAAMAGKYGHPIVYVADMFNDVVDVLVEGRHGVVAQISHGVHRPMGLLVARNLDLYVANQADGTVSMYHPAAAHPYKHLVLRGKNAQAAGVALDSHGNVYVSNYKTSEIQVFAPGTSRPRKVLKDPGQSVFYIATDSSGDLFVMGYNKRIEEFVAGSDRPVELTAVRYSSPGGLAIDRDDDLYICDNQGGIVTEYAPPYTSGPINSMPYLGFMTACALDPGARSIWTVAFMTSSSAAVRYAFPTGKIQQYELYFQISTSYGIAVSPPD